MVDKKITREKYNGVAFIIALIITIIVMFLFIQQKQGWHEDEIFSYGSSNYKYDNLFQRYAYKDSLNQLIDEKIMDKNPIETLKNIGYYITHQKEFNKAYEEKKAQEHPIWKTSQDALDYVSVSNDEIFSYWSVYYNQSRDVHPPLFYMLVHFVSSFCLNHFSKYIIFTINLAFFIGSCLIIRKIMKLFHKDNLSAVAILMYGLSMGAISMVMFQRMYMMLTFFVLTYLYLNTKIAKDEFKMDKKTKRLLLLTIVLGFLTQYYFCIYIVILATITCITMLKNKQYTQLKDYIVCHIKAALIGVIIFPASIYHIFFSYRGVAGGVSEKGYIENLIAYIQKVFYAFSIPEMIGYMLIGALTVLWIIVLLKVKRKDIMLMVSVPIIGFICIIAKIAPFINIRYISPVLPIIVIAIVFIIQDIINYGIKKIQEKHELSKSLKQYISVVIIFVITIGISIYGFKNSKPEFLYESFSKRIEIAQKYKDLKLVYVGESEFSHLQDMEEFLRYDTFLIINTYQLDVLKEDETIKEQEEYILNIKCWVSNFDETLKQVLAYTNAQDYELLIDDGESKVYKVFRQK